VILVVLSPWTPWIDQTVARHFYRDGHFSQNGFLRFAFHYGELFGFFVCALAVMICLGSYFFKSWVKYRRTALLMVLTTVIGAGFIVNILCKGFLGRPRPKQVTEFGGTLSYRPFWQPNLDPERSPQKSFPSGHVAMGFAYLPLIVGGRRDHLPWVTYLGWGLLVFWGPLLILARLAQGGHFVSDAAVSILVMWWTTLLIDALLCRYAGGHHGPSN